VGDEMRNLMKILIRVRGAAPFFTALALTSFVSASSTAEQLDSPSRRPEPQLAGRQRAAAPKATAPSAPSRSEIAEEEFAIHAAKLPGGKTANHLVTTIEFAPTEARFVRLIIRRTNGGEACID
jgi:hypothetical protein